VKRDSQGWEGDFPMWEEVEDYAGKARPICTRRSSRAMAKRWWGPRTRQAGLPTYSTKQQC
jgi:hypothetical protein